MADSDTIVKVAPYAAEFVGTFALVLTAEWCTLTGADVNWSVLAVASMLVIMVYACGPISGGQLNPAVSLSLGLAGRTEWKVVFGYWIAQLFAGLSAGALSRVLLREAVAPALKPMLFDRFPWQYAGGVELIYTCMLCFVFLNVTLENWRFKGNDWYGLAIGLVVVAGGYAAGGISGATFNPAIIIAFDLALWDGSCFHSLNYVIWQCAGAILAVGLFRVIRPKPDEDSPLMSKLVGEAVGTFFVVVTVCLNLVVGSRALHFSATAALASISYAMYGVAGSFNPAVTLGICLNSTWDDHWLRPWTRTDHLFAVLTQFGGGALAGLTAGAYCWARNDLPQWIEVEAGQVARALNYPLLTACFAEWFFTTILVFVFLAVWIKDSDSGPTPQYFGLIIGLCITAGGFAAGPVSGGILNPAVGFGISIEGYLNKLGGNGLMDPDCWITFLYWSFAEFLGGVSGCGLFSFIYYKQREKYKPVKAAPAESKNDKPKQSERTCSLW